MAEFDLEDHDKVIKLEERVENEVKRSEEKFEEVEKTVKAGFEAVNKRFDESQLLMTNHLKHHEDTEKTHSDRWFKILTIILQAATMLLLGYAKFTK